MMAKAALRVLALPLLASMPAAANAGVGDNQVDPTASIARQTNKTVGVVDIPYWQPNAVDKYREYQDINESYLAAVKRGVVQAARVRAFSSVRVGSFRKLVGLEVEKSSSEALVAAGKSVGVDYIVNGQIQWYPNDFSITVNIFDVGVGRFAPSLYYRGTDLGGIPCEIELYTVCHLLGFLSKRYVSGEDLAVCLAQNATLRSVECDAAWKEVYDPMMAEEYKRVRGANVRVGPKAGVLSSEKTKNGSVSAVASMVGGIATRVYAFEIDLLYTRLGAKTKALAESNVVVDAVDIPLLLCVPIYLRQSYPSFEFRPCGGYKVALVTNSTVPVAAKYYHGFVVGVAIDFVPQEKGVFRRDESIVFEGRFGGGSIGIDQGDSAAVNNWMFLVGYLF